MSSGWIPLWRSSQDKGTVPPDASSPIDREPSNSPDRKTARTISTHLTSGSWMNWRRYSNDQYLKDHEDAIGDNDESRKDESQKDVSNDEMDDDDNDETNNDDEIDDHISGSRKKSISSWGFWGSHRDSMTSTEEDTGKETVELKENQKDKKDTRDKKKEEPENFSNTILTSKSTSNLSLHPEFNEEQQDDAVLYKPHDDAKQFNKINTHKNENLKENIIVPDWDSCLPNQSSLLAGNSITSTIFGNTSTSSQNSSNGKVDAMNWKSFLSQLSTKLGFNSQTLSNVIDEEGEDHDETSINSSASKDKIEKEFNLLYERTYKLFGRSLAKLPDHKRGCLPSYNKFYTKSEDDSYVYNQKTQLEEDESDPMAISITNDPMGNLLINQRNPTRQGKAQVRNAEVVRQKSHSLSKIKKILIIGVHGFFPTKMIRPLIGAPKGTSLKFATEAEKAVLRYCIDNKLIDEDDSKLVSIQKIALEKEGKIFDRVEFFTEILAKWEEELNAADFIFIAAHSQGCVVSIILLAQLIKMGILKDAINKRIGILGMAGINNGPFYGVDKTFFMKAYSAIEHDSMIELFELTKFTSEQSLVYKESIQVIINANVKICFIGSINDQLVPMYSALASHIYHPNIYRACYIDHSSQTPLFIQKLVSLCCHLQNIGYFDNNVMKELSYALAGPLTGGGHSKIYNDGKVYDLGIKFVLDTDDLVIPPTGKSKPSVSSVSFKKSISSPKDGFVTHGVGSYGSIPIDEEAQEIIKLPLTNQVYIKEFNISKIGTNPFILPWCLRGLLFNIEKNWPNNNKLLSVEKGSKMGKTGYDEINELYDLFDGWKPESKILKDLKFRLNGLRASKL